MTDIGQSKNIKDVTHGVLVLDENGALLRFIGFWKEPSQEALKQLDDELKQELTVPYTLYEATPEIIREMLT